MPTEKAPYRVLSVASVTALATMAAGAFLVHQTLQGTSDGSGLSAWSVALALLWIAGWRVLVAHAPHPVRERTAKAPSLAQRHPLAVTLMVGTIFAIVSLVGALMLRESPFFGGDVANAASRVADSPVIVFCIALVTGVSEELFFRLGLSRLLAGRWFPLGSTVAYGIITLATGSLALTLAAVLLGAITSVSLMQTGRWYSPVIVHALWTVALIGVFPLL